MKRNYITLSILLLVSYLGFSQEDDSESNIQTYTPSKLLDKGQADIKFFNNLYTEIEEIGNGVKSDKPRETYFTSTLDFFVGVSENNRVNLGLLLEYRSNIINGESATSVFKFGNEEGVSRNGLSSFATAIKWQPLENIGNFSIQTAFHVPFIREESSEGVFLDQTAYIIQNRFFFDHTFPGNKWQLFTELNTEYNYGNKDSFANNTFLIAPGVFMSYFPTNKTTVLGFVQHAQRVGDPAQDYTALGAGGKYQLTNSLNLEILYSKFVRGADIGLGQSFNIGLRALL